MIIYQLVFIGFWTILIFILIRNQIILDIRGKLLEKRGQYIGNQEKFEQYTRYLDNICWRDFRKWTYKSFCEVENE